jgi:NADH:ubiquinone oxidoreductase subunit 5 (subunit L)/multisubunit Na+/H+ antiporter MnhA subunit
MAWPLRALAICAVFVGLATGPTEWFAGYLHHAIGLAEVEAPPAEIGLMAISVAAVLLGIGLAWWMYVVAKELPAKVAAAMGPLYYASLNKFYFDEIFWAIIIAPLRALAWLSSWFDRSVIDSIVDGLALVPRLFSTIPLIFQNGRLPSYALVMWTGLLICLVFALRLLAH